MIQVNLEERTRRYGEDSQLECPAQVVSVHVVLPDGTIKRCQLAKTRTFPFLRIGWKRDGNRIIGIDWVDLTAEWKEAGATFLIHDYEAEDRAKGYQEYCAWEEAADLYKNRSAKDKKRLIPDIRPHLPKSVRDRQDEKVQSAAHFPAAVIEAAKELGSNEQPEPPEPPEDAGTTRRRRKAA